MINIKEDAVMAILLAVLIVCPWAILGLDIKPKSSADIVVVPSEGPALSSPVSPMFGRSRYFLIINLKNGTVKAVQNRFRLETHAVGLRVAHLLLNEKAGIVIAKRIGPEPFRNLNARGIRIYVGNPTTVEDAVRQLKRKTLAEAKRPNAQIHFGLEQQQKKAQQPGSRLL